MNTESRESWYAKADCWENKFVEKYGKKFYVEINPSKKTDPFAPDLYMLRKYKSADLKYQSVPFYKSSQYGIDPNFAWTFNVSDALEYSIKYSDSFGLFIWLNYQESLEYGVKIESQESVYYTELGLIKKSLSGSVHKYSRRINDTNGNSYGSHIMDLRSLAFRKIL